MYYTEYESPIGTLLLTSDGTSLTGLWMGKVPSGAAAPQLAVFREAAQWLDAYFAGEPGTVNFPLSPSGTAFQQLIWKLLSTIPFGQTRSYGELAKEAAAIMGKKFMSSQAVGGAVGRNPISIIIPCHRVIGANGALTGYAGGLSRKEWLLRHEEEHK